MCCFSRAVDRVADTRIFARQAGEDRQHLVYAMQLSAAEELAMILPLPTPAGSPEDALAFVDLQGYPTFFEDVAKAFPAPLEDTAEPSSRSFGDRKAAPLLEVVKVGAFDASFVPTLADFERLDPRFRIAPDAWAALPQYADWGFAVFKLRGGERQEVHPMAFTFPTRDPSRLFFPTVHIHDGEVHERADFDHALSCQLPEGAATSGAFAARWTESTAPLDDFVDVRKARGVVAEGDHAYLRRLEGRHPNQDVWVELG